MNEVDSQITCRLYDPVVKNVYQHWKNQGLLDATMDIIHACSPVAQSVILPAFVGHVHKEKGLFLDMIGSQLNISPATRKYIAASADVLWAISLAVDDFVDKDETRADAVTAWKRYSPEIVMQTAEEGIKQCVRSITKITPQPVIGDYFVNYIKIAVESLSRHRHYDLGTSTTEIIRNYQQRCDFHSTLQLSIFRIIDPASSEIIDQAIQGFRFINQAGQLINDLKDILPADLYHRRFSDIRNGLVSVPILEMYRQLHPAQSGQFCQLFGKGYVSVEDATTLRQLVDSTDIVARTQRRIKSYYDIGGALLEACLPQNDIRLIQQWSEYKQQALR